MDTSNTETPTATIETPSATPTPTKKPRTTAKNSPKGIADRLLRAEKAIEGTEANADIIAIVATFGYDATKRATGKTLLTQVHTLVLAAQESKAVQVRVNGELQSAETACRLAYSSLAGVARAIFLKDKAALAALGLVGKTPRTLAGFLLAAEKLFDGALGTSASVKAQLAAYGYTTERLTSERATLTALHAASRAQDTAKGETQSLTISLNTALEALDAYVMQYRKIARIALKGNPQLLEKLGITV